MLFKRVQILFIGLLLRLVLDYSYVEFVQPLYDYMGFKDQYELWTYVLSLFFTFVCLLSMPIRLVQASDFLKSLFLIILILPMHSLMGLAGASIEVALGATLSYLYIVIPLFGVGLRIAALRNGLTYAVAVSLAASLLLFAYKIGIGAYSYASFDLNAVYELRAMLGNETVSPFFSYLEAWTVTAFNIFLLAWAIKSRHRLIIIGAIVLQIFLFSVTGHKSILMYLLMVVGFRLFLYKKPMCRDLILSFSAVIAGSVMLWQLQESLVLVPSIFVRRLLFVPAQINFLYIEYFADLKLVYFSNSFLSAVLEYPFSQPVPRLVSELAYGNPDTWMNSGYLGAGYMQMGWLGVMIYSSVMKFVLWLTDALSKGMEAWFAAALVAPPFLILITSADLPTTFLTHGFAMSLILLWLASSKYGGAIGQPSDSIAVNPSRSAPSLTEMDNER